jgi:alkylation response protein AidB-like acyl-CoA dehydrogenase
MFTSLLATPEQLDLRDGVRRFLREQAPIETAREVAETGAPSRIWPRLADEIGVGFLLLPEHVGGLESSLTELCVVAEEGGYQLLTGPFFSTVLAARTLARAGFDDAAFWESLSNGSTVVAPALTGSPGQWNADAVSVTAESGTLTGRCDLVVDDLTADRFLVAACTSGGIGLYLLEASALGVHRTSVDTLDRTRPLVRLELSQAEAREIQSSIPAEEAIAAAYDDAAVVLAAEQVGVAQRALDLAVDYVKTREQFGRVVGSFQAVKHLLGDALVGVESARSAVSVASHAQGDVGSRASLTLARSSQVAIKVTETSIQAHGGIGYTWEHDAHLLLKRARANSLLLGAPAEHRRRVLNSMGA